METTPDTAKPFTGDGEERSPEAIEREIADTRAAIETTVEELGERLRPGQIAEEARSYVREKAARGASEAWRSVNETLRDNALPIALVGGGLAALLAMRQGHNGHAPKRYGAEAAERVLALAHELREARGVARAQHQANRVRSDLASLMEEQPLLVGVASFALGALLGALPSAGRQT